MGKQNRPMNFWSNIDVAQPNIIEIIHKWLDLFSMVEFAYNNMVHL